MKKYEFSTLYCIYTSSVNSLHSLGDSLAPISQARLLLGYQKSELPMIGPWYPPAGICVGSLTNRVITYILEQIPLLKFGLLPSSTTLYPASIAGEVTISCLMSFPQTIRPAGATDILALCRPCSGRDGAIRVVVSMVTDTEDEDFSLPHPPSARTVGSNPSCPRLSFSRPMLPRHHVSQAS